MINTYLLDPKFNEGDVRRQRRQKFAALLRNEVMAARAQSAAGQSEARRAELNAKIRRENAENARKAEIERRNAARRAAEAKMRKQKEEQQKARAQAAAEAEAEAATRNGATNNDTGADDDDDLFGEREVSQVGDGDKREHSSQPDKKSDAICRPQGWKPGERWRPKTEAEIIAEMDIDIDINIVEI